MTHQEARDKALRELYWESVACFYMWQMDERIAKRDGDPDPFMGNLLECRRLMAEYTELSRQPYPVNP